MSAEPALYTVASVSKGTPVIHSRKPWPWTGSCAASGAGLLFCTRFFHHWELEAEGVACEADRGPVQEVGCCWAVLGVWSLCIH